MEFSHKSFNTKKEILKGKNTKSQFKIQNLFKFKFRTVFLSFSFTFIFF